MHAAFRYQWVRKILKYFLTNLKFFLETPDVSEINLEDSTNDDNSSAQNSTFAKSIKSGIKSPKTYFLENLKRKRSNKNNSTTNSKPKKSQSVTNSLTTFGTKFSRRKLGKQNDAGTSNSENHCGSFEDGFTSLEKVPADPPETEEKPLNEPKSVFWRSSRYKVRETSPPAVPFSWSSHFQSKSCRK